ncbi:MAG: hypothetical protein HN478_08260 [Rhodospirillaceae bacterium]|jgi:hypothetical protein|nr:hypothetical protein [Rhodospirillaceae bacterium]MBT4044582.1 hypothetical protein [Rhodospirillaceae bacterium]MBT4487025.1 hypothetical protein [Rhodospirillaceae bacterium]MBT5192153.1 hypothetical protein [Rhodospirillaceae bacterium]MBT5896272.1 hypothetical protein [Rhodospirillaceae bacterium]
MDLTAFKATLNGAAPPVGLDKAVEALWRVARDEWDAAHKLAQDQDDAEGAWVHAHLHRVEGDLRNAGYWYRRADKPESTVALDAEWDEIAAALL